MEPNRGPDKEGETAGGWGWRRRTLREKEEVEDLTNYSFTKKIILHNNFTRKKIKEKGWGTRESCRRARNAAQRVHRERNTNKIASFGGERIGEEDIRTETP